MTQRISKYDSFLFYATTSVTMYLKNLAKPIPLFDQETVVENLQKEG